MSLQYKPGFKNCITCNYWGGTRKCGNFGESVECEQGANGKCYCQTSGWYLGGPKRFNDTCISWRKWSALK